jgi:hypothetical protein
MDRINELIEEVEKDLILIKSIQEARAECIKNLAKFVEFERRLKATPVDERQFLADDYKKLLEGILLN